MNRHVGVLLAVCSSVAPAQAPIPWNDARALELVQRATERRAAQLADTGLVDYRAQAHGYLTFLAQLGEGFPDPPKVLKADELVLEVYWRAPNLSKQRIIGRRDTLLVATDINYHRDHLGIVQNNFPTIIRLGDGDEVRDVPHPLSASGAPEYDFAITDSLTINLGTRELEVLEVRFRPKNDQLPRAVGALYLDRGEAQVARMTLGFTRASLKDKQLDDVSIVLDNGLVEGRFWLPRRQSIEIRRSGSWMDFPARGIIRGRWEICCVEVNQGLTTAMFAGPEIVAAPPSVLQTYQWQGRIVDSLPPDITAVREDDIRKVQSDARALVRAQGLDRARTATISARGVSDLVRVNRVEGLAVGFGVLQRLGNGFALGAKGRYGTADHEAKGVLTLRSETGSGVVRSIAAYRDYRDFGDIQETSLLRNSIAAQEFGSDYTDLFDSRGGRAQVEARLLGARSFAQVALEWQRPLTVHARPARGTYEPTIRAERAREHRLTVGMRWSGSSVPTEIVRRGGFEFRLAQYQAQEGRRAGYPSQTYGRLFLDGALEAPVRFGRLVLWSAAGATWGIGDGIVMVGPGPVVPDSSDGVTQSLVYLGGPVTGPGYEYHQFAGVVGATGRLEWQFPVPFPSLSLGRFGRTGNRAVLAPFGQTILMAEASGKPRGFYPSVGVGLLTLFDMLRLDVARGVRGGRWTFSADVSSAFWGIL